MSRKTEIGAAVVALRDDVVRHTLQLVQQYREAPERLKPALIKQAVDTPHRARAQLQAWMNEFSSAARTTAQDFLTECLAAVGANKTLADINSELQALESQAEVLVQKVKDDKWTWEQVADAIEEQFANEPDVRFDYRTLPIPKDYKTIWGDKY